VSGAGTSLVLFKQALCEELRARPGLADVEVLYAPTDAESAEAIWFGKAETEELSIATLRAGKLHLQEKYDLYGCVQVRQTEGQTQESADVRAVAILAELQQELTEAPDTCDDIQWASLHSWKHVGGKLGTGHGSRFEFTIRVHARME
jgi:hypothetical protein